MTQIIKKITTLFTNTKTNDKMQNNENFLSFLKNKTSKLIEFCKNMIISANDQRKISFGKKLKTGVFTPMNILSISKTILKCRNEGKSFKETSKAVLIDFVKIISGMFFCHITTSLMENLVNKLLKTGIGALISKAILYLSFPPAPTLLFIIDILISWLGGKVVDLIIWLYNKYIKQYAERAFDCVKTKVKKVWIWLKSFF